MEFVPLNPPEQMVSHSPTDNKELVREAIDIVDLVGRYVQLRRSGRNFVGLCPWHDDTRPSLQINPERQSYKCWVCDIGGDVFSFVMQMEGVDFREALEMLADQAGIPLESPRPSASSSTSAGSAREGKRALYRALEWARNQYHEHLLHAEEAEPARRYLAERGISGESIRAFHLGFSPLQGDWLLSKVGGQAGRVERLEKVGILAEGRSDFSRPGAASHYDRFRGRVLFPIHDTQERTVAFGARLLPDSPLNSKAKYVNSPETPLFSKHRMLYGLDRARLEMRKTGRALIMEGYTDVIIAHQFGFRDAVAVLGTALGEEHVRLLRRFADRMVLVLDGDEAGRRRADQVLELFVAQGVDLSILTLPVGSDPCDFLQSEGAEAFSQMLDGEAVDAMDHAFRSATSGVDLEKDIVASSKALDHLLGILAGAPHRASDASDPQHIRHEKMLQRLASQFQVPEREIRQRLRQWRQRKMKSRPASPSPEAKSTSPSPREDSPYSDEMLYDDLAGLEAGPTEEAPPSREASPEAVPRVAPDPLERDLLEVLVSTPTTIGKFAERIDGKWLRTPCTRSIFEWLERRREEASEEALTFDRLMLHYDDPWMKNLLVELDHRGREKDVAENPSLHEEIIEAFARREWLRQTPRQLHRLREDSLSGEEKHNLLLEFQRKQRVRHGITDPTEG